MSDTPFITRGAWGWWAVTLVLAVGAALAGWLPLTATSLAIVAICATAELADASIGVGFGTAVVPVLLIAGYGPREIVPAVLLAQPVGGVTAWVFHRARGNVDARGSSPHVRTVVLLSVTGIAGAVAGATLSVNLPEDALITAIAVVLIATGIAVLATARLDLAPRWWSLALVGTVAAFDKAISGGGYGPLLTGGQLLSGVRAKAAVAITSLTEVFACLAALATFAAHDWVPHAEVIAPMLLGSLIPGPVAASAVKRSSERALRYAIGALTAVLGAVALVGA